MEVIYDYDGPILNMGQRNPIRKEVFFIPSQGNVFQKQ